MKDVTLLWASVFQYFCEHFGLYHSNFVFQLHNLKSITAILNRELHPWLADLLLTITQQQQI
jgi:hypothetical protein